MGTDEAGAEATYPNGRQPRESRWRGGDHGEHEVDDAGELGSTTPASSAAAANSATAASWRVAQLDQRHSG